MSPLSVHECAGPAGEGFETLTVSGLCDVTRCSHQDVAGTIPVSRSAKSPERQQIRCLLVRSRALLCRCTIPQGAMWSRHGECVHER